MAGVWVCLLTAWSVQAQPPRAAGPIHIVAAMVEFQPDDNRFTTGDGTFNPDFLERNAVTLDPLPHDRGYFEAHLEFAKRYFGRVSGGASQITYEVLPTVYRLPHEMARYSPIGEADTANYRLAWLARDAWEHIAEAGGLAHVNGDPDRTLFVLFHAGVGRDLELSGTTLDKAPQDIPSVFLDDSAFDGYTVPGTGFPIRNTAILPETESRPGTDVSGAEFVLELSLNGLVTAMVGNYLGLPDLYNTETGASAIGRFGLMDGAGFFSYFGLFPPEPSAWEKTHMGWVTPQDIPLDDSPIDVPAGAVWRHRITADEIVLVENRHRNPAGGDLELTVRRPDGSIETVRIAPDDTRFNPFDFSEIADILPSGVVIEVSHYDASLPGGYDVGLDGREGTADDRILNGGILIWQVQEALIRERLATNTINTVEGSPAIRLVEADGAYDIGRPAATSADYSQGAPFDFWWSGNDFTVILSNGQRVVRYANRWAADTYPPNVTLSGAPSGFEFHDFSDNLPTARFRARPAAVAGATQAPVIDLGRATTQTDAHAQGHPLAIVPLGAKVAIPAADGVHIADTSSHAALFLPFAGPHQPLALGTRLFLTGSEAVGTSTDPARFYETAAPVPQLLWEQAAAGRTLGYPTPVPGAIHLGRTDLRVSTTDGSLVPVATAGIYAEDGTLLLAENTVPAGTRRAQVFQVPNGSTLATTPYADSGTDSWPHWTDLDGDYSPDLVFTTAEGQVVASNANGAHLNGFPLAPPNGLRFIGTPLVVDTDGDNRPDLLVSATDGISHLILTYTNEGRPTEAPALLVGSAPTPATHSILPLFHNQTLFAVSTSGELRRWYFPDAETRTVSPLDYRIALVPVVMPTIAPLLITAETYAWPVPAEDHTHIRFATHEPAEVHVRIVNYDGRLVGDWSAPSSGQVPTEIRIDTGTWGSGVYFVSVRARNDDREGVHTFPILVRR